METSLRHARRSPVTLRLPFTASSVAVARSRLRSWLVDVDVSGERVEDARVVISELVANSVRHAEPLADGSILVSWVLQSRGLQVSVTDGGSGTRPRTVHSPPSALAGRGLAIVETLTIDWWSERKRSGSTVHALLSLH